MDFQHWKSLAVALLLNLFKKDYPCTAMISCFTILVSFQCCYRKGWSWLVGSCHMTHGALAAIWEFEMFLSRCGTDAPGKSEHRFHYERACRASTFEITNLSAQKMQYVNGPYGCFFLPEHLQVSGGGQTESWCRKPSTLSLRPFLFECVPSLAFSSFSFLP